MTAAGMSVPVLILIAALALLRLVCRPSSVFCPGVLLAAPLLPLGARERTLLEGFVPAPPLAAWGQSGVSRRLRALLLLPLLL